MCNNAGLKRFLKEESLHRMQARIAREQGDLAYAERLEAYADRVKRSAEVLIKQSRPNPAK